MAEVPIADYDETPSFFATEASSSEESGNTATADESIKGLAFTHVSLVLQILPHEQMI